MTVVEPFKIHNHFSCSKSFNRNPHLHSIKIIDLHLNITLPTHNNSGSHSVTNHFASKSITNHKTTQICFLLLIMIIMMSVTCENKEFEYKLKTWIDVMFVEKNVYAPNECLQNLHILKRFISDDLSELKEEKKTRKWKTILFFGCWLNSLAF